MIDLEKYSLKEKELTDLEGFLKYNIYNILSKEKLERNPFRFFLGNTLIPLYEKAISHTFEKLSELQKGYSTHAHVNNMAKTFEKLLKYVMEEYSHLNFLNEIIKIFSNDTLERYKNLKEAYNPIYEIWTAPEITHNQRRLLTKPYWYDFWSTYLNVRRYNDFPESYNQLYDEVLKEYLSRKETLWENNIICPNCGGKIEDPTKIRSAETGKSYCTDYCATEDVNKNYIEDNEEVVK